MLHWPSSAQAHKKSCLVTPAPVMLQNKVCIFPNTPYRDTSSCRVFCRYAAISGCLNIYLWSKRGHKSRLMFVIPSWFDWWTQKLRSGAYRHKFSVDWHRSSRTDRRVNRHQTCLISFNFLQCGSIFSLSNGYLLTSNMRGGVCANI